MEDYTKLFLFVFFCVRFSSQTSDFEPEVGQNPAGVGDGPPMAPGSIRLEDNRSQSLLGISPSSSSSVRVGRRSHVSRSRSPQPRSVPGHRAGGRGASRRARNWCFTDFSQLDFKQQFADSETRIRYLVVGLELCPESGRRHAQGFVQFTDCVSMSTVKRRLASPSIHLECMRGSVEQASDYCRKDGDFSVFGQFISMGDRMDLDSVRVAITEGVSDLKLAESDFPQWCRNYRAFRDYRFLHLQESSLEWRGAFPVIVLEGVTRCGKTRLARKYGDYILGGYQMKWWDGYHGQACVIIDDFAQDCPIQHFLRILDGHQLRLQTKGSHTWAFWRAVIITTNLPFMSMYQDAPAEHVAALHARITRRISCFEGDVPLPDVIEELEFLNA